MAEDATILGAEEGRQTSWRAAWASLGALLAALLLIGLIFGVSWTNRARDQAVQQERHTYEVMTLTRTIDASIARSEGALGR